MTSTSTPDFRLAVSDLPDNQRGVLTLILAGRTQKDAAHQVGVCERTVSRWVRQPAFRLALYQARLDTWDAVTGQLQRGAARAVDTLMDLLDAPSLAARAAAARLLLDQARRNLQQEEATLRLLLCLTPPAPDNLRLPAPPAPPDCPDSPDPASEADISGHPAAPPHPADSPDPASEADNSGPPAAPPHPADSPDSSSEPDISGHPNPRRTDLGLTDPGDARGGRYGIALAGKPRPSHLHP